MRGRTKKFGEICLVSGILFTQISTLGVFSTTAYAVTGDEISTFIMQANKSKAKVDEDIVLEIENPGNQDDKVELQLPEGVNFNEEATKKLNETNEAIETIRVVEHSTIQIQRKAQSSGLGKVFLSIKGNKPGDFAFVAKVQYGDTEVKTKAVNLNVSENVQEAIQEPDNLLIEKTEELNEETRVVEKTTSDGKVDVQPTEGMSGQIDENAQEEEKSEATSKGSSKEGNNVTSNREELNAANDTNAEIVEVEEEKQTATALVEHADETHQSIIQYPNVNVISSKDGTGSMIPGEYALQWRWSTQVKYKIVGSTTDTNSTYQSYDFTNVNPDKESYVHIEKAGIYMGRWLDIRVNIIKFDGVTKVNVATPRKVSGKKDFLQMRYWGRVGSSADISYEFYDHETGELVPVSGMWNINKLNSHKAIDLNVDKKHFNSLYTYDNTTITYKDNGDGTANFVGTAGGAAGKDTNMTFTYTGITELPMRIHRLGDSTSRVRYEYEAMSKVGIPHPEVIGEVTEGADRELYYHVYQDMPPQAIASSNPTSFVLESKVNPDFDVKNVKILDEDEKDISSYFDITRENDKVTATAKANIVNKSEFGGKFYDMQIRGSLKEEADFKKYYKKGYLEVPVSAKNYIDGDKKGQEGNQGIAKIQYKGTPTGKAVPQTVRINTDLSKMDISTFVTELSVDTDDNIDKPISVVRLENIPKTNVIGEYFVTAVIRTAQGVEERIQVPIKVVVGTLKLVNVPQTISFENLLIPSKPTIYNPTSMNGKLTVADERIKRQKWRVDVKETKPLTSRTNDKLEGAMIYTTKDGTDLTLSKESVEVISHTPTDDKSIEVNWEQNEGIRLQVVPGPNVKMNTKYQGELTWTLTDAPN
ncbi:cell surface protein [Bacillus thuringiensis]|nr:cell surface protein [Bacillus thuringiensis]